MLWYIRILYGINDGFKFLAFWEIVYIKCDIYFISNFIY